MQTRSVVLILAALLLRCTQATEDAPPPKIGIDETFLDPTVSPCTDFYQYACGTWIGEHPLDGVSYRTRMLQTTSRNSVLIGKIIEDDAAGKPYLDHADADKVGSYYTACLASRESGALSPLLPLSPVADKISLATTPDGLAAATAEVQAAGSGALFDLYAAVDPGDPTRRVLTFSEPWFGLPHRDYYLDPALAVDADYIAHIQNMSAIVGSTLAVQDASGVLALERALAAGTLTDVEWQNPVGIYHLTSWDAFVAAAPHFAWSTYLAAAGIAQPTEVNVTSPAYLTTLDTVLASASATALRDELDWSLLEAQANTLGTDAVTEEAKFHWGVFYGDPTPNTPSGQCKAATKGALSYAIAQPFVRIVFDEESKAHVTGMLANVKTAFGGILSSRDWLDEATKAEAAAKLTAVLDKVGYPSAWPGYGDLVVGSGSFLENQLALDRAYRAWNLTSLDQPVDRTSWAMSPVTDNAMYSGSRNDITFPAAFLQPPHYEPTFGDAYNYGAVGTTMGHELTHGFDASGRLYDAAGKVRDWWNQAVAEEFTKRSTCLVDQYSQYEVAPGVKVDGAATVDENIADLGGLRAAWAAYQALGDSETFVGSFGADQQFFLSYAQMWCSNFSAEAAATRVTVDSHAPDRFRVNGVVSNMAEFAAAFRCPAGSPMVRSPRCEIW